MDKLNSYFYVFRLGGSAPKHKHATLELAKQEATRLATQHPGGRFEILMFVGAAEAVYDVRTNWADGAELMRAYSAASGIDWGVPDSVPNLDSGVTLHGWSQDQSGGLFRCGQVRNPYLQETQDAAEHDEKI